jgi:ribosome maturation factor RimP
LEALLSEFLMGNELFLVEIHFGGDGKIRVFIDGMKNVSLKQCADVNRFLRDKLGAELDSYELVVSSPGLDKPFRHQKQFEKSIDSEVEVMTNDGNTIRGILISVDGDGFSVRESIHKKIKKKAVLPEKIFQFRYDAVKQTKKLITI